MPTPYPNIPPGFGLVRLEFTLAGAQHNPQIIYGYKDTTGGSVIAAADLHFGIWGADMMPDLATDLVLIAAHVVRNAGGTLEEGNSTSAPAPGGSANVPVPANTSILIRKGTGLIGRHFQGRMYVPGCPRTDTDSAGSVLTSVSVGGFQADAAGLLGHLTTDFVQMYLLHRSPTVAPTVVTGLSVESRLATQSRRLRKVAHR